MKLLIVIDMQNDFIDGSLGTKEAVAIVPNVAQKIAKARAAGETVVFTRDTPSMPRQLPLHQATSILALRQADTASSIGIVILTP